MTVRILVLMASFLAASVYIAKVSKAETIVNRQPLSLFPLEVGRWEGAEASVLDARVVAALGVDDHLNRIYLSGDRVIGTYIGYYSSQREGDAIHSPMNCLPGAGWNPAERDRVTIPVSSSPQSPEQRGVEVNRVIIQKGLEKQIVLYWYQARGRVIASEYWGKVYLVMDAIQVQRSDAALIRVISPVKGQGSEAEAAAQREAVEFVQSAFPLLSRYLPE